MLEALVKEKNEQRLIFIINFKNRTEFQVGRQNDSDIRINDITVSRHHAMLKLINENIYIEDLNSKFGTMILVQNEIQLLPFKNISFQVGKFYLDITMEKTCLGFICCNL